MPRAQAVGWTSKLTFFCQQRTGGRVQTDAERCTYGKFSTRSFRMHHFIFSFWENRLGNSSQGGVMSCACCTVTRSTLQFLESIHCCKRACIIFIIWWAGFQAVRIDSYLDRASLRSGDKQGIPQRVPVDLAMKYYHLFFCASYHYNNEAYLRRDRAPFRRSTLTYTWPTPQLPMSCTTLSGNVNIGLCSAQTFFEGTVGWTTRSALNIS